MRDIILKYANWFKLKFGTNTDLTKYYILCLERTGDYGRSNRAEFWWFILTNFLISFAISIASSVIQAIIAIPAGFVNNEGIQMIFVIISGIVGLGLGLISLAYTILIIWPTISISIRRLHDTNRSGWWYLMQFCCCIVNIIFYCLPGVEPNNYSQSTVGNNNTANNNQYQQTNHSNDLYQAYQNQQPQQNNQMVEESGYGQANHADDSFEM